MHEDPVTKSKRVTNSAGAVVSTVELDPWGADTNRSSNAAFQPKKFTSYERDSNGTDEAMARRYNRWQSRFDQPDPYDGSYSLANPQSFNRYAYVNGDPVNFVDPTGLATCYTSRGVPFTCSDEDKKILDGAQKEEINHSDSYWSLPHLRDHPAIALFFPESPSPTGGTPLLVPHPPQNPKPTNPANSQQQGFNDCATKANRAFRWRYLQTSGMAIVGGASIGLGLGVALTGIPRIGVIGVRAFFRTAATGAVVEASHEGALGVQAGASAILPGSLLAIHSITEAQRNEDRVNAAIENCKKQHPNANHTFSSLNF